MRQRQLQQRRRHGLAGAPCTGAIALALLLLAAACAAPAAAAKPRAEKHARWR